MSDIAGDKKQQASKITKLFQRKKGNGKQASNAAGTLVPESVKEPTFDDLIAAVQQPSGLEAQADSPGVVHQRCSC